MNQPTEKKPSLQFKSCRVGHRYVGARCSMCLSKANKAKRDAKRR